MERSRQPGEYGCGIICLARACGAFAAIGKLVNSLFEFFFVCASLFTKACVNIVYFIN